MAYYFKNKVREKLKYITSVYVILFVRIKVMERETPIGNIATFDYHHQIHVLINPVLSPFM